ncbi:hypothetical protein QBC47DRAFT_355268 [Echria macrotheca]|uniref:Uncharacterized protein n=1 Tax=Echria macrotheca TaxID=438768 RepID=A0AAJ0BKU2_9PEZI|nr:hypothetical protein QBC47DRAFT_355268 [Echria macrotheca]
MTRLTILALVATVAATPLAPQSFHYRFYEPANCDHANPPESTYPWINSQALNGKVNDCYNAPTALTYQRLEIDTPPGGIITFCETQCQGRGSIVQSGTNCFGPLPGCTIRSFKTI